MEHESMFDKDIERISIVTDVDVDELESLTASDIFRFKSVLEYIHKEPHKKHKREIEFDELHLNYIGLDSLTLAEFIDLDNYYVNNIIHNLHLVAGVLYRQHRTDNWNQSIQEPYNYDPQTRGHLFKTIPISDIYGITAEFRKFHQDFMDNYEGLFPEPEEELEEEPEEDESPEERKERREREKEEAQQKKWGWERLIFELSGRDITKVDAVLQSNLVLTFNQLSMKKELGL